MTLFALFFTYQYYLRFILADAGLSLNGFKYTVHIPSDYPLVLVLQALTLMAFTYYLLRIDFISRAMLRLLSGFFGAGLALLLFASFNHYLDLPFKKRWHEPLYESKHTFVEILKDKTPLKEKPNSQSVLISILPKNEFFIYKSSKTKNGLRWDQVKLSQNKTGWIPNKILPAYGVAEEALSKTEKFSFKYYDLYGLITGILAFIWGYMSFRIRPG